MIYDLGFSFFSFHRADNPTPETLTTLKRTPGISPLALPLRPKPERSTSSFSSTKLRQPSLGTAIKSLLAHVLPFALAINIYADYIPNPCPIGSLPSIPPAENNIEEEPTESSNLLSVLDQLHPNTLPNSRVGLFGFDSDLLENYSLCVRRTSERRGFEGRSEGTLLV